MTEPLFRSTHNALLFAHNFNHAQYEPTILARLIEKNYKPGKGLAGLDGAGQSGMILGAVRDIGALEAAFMVMRYAPSHRKCDCKNSCCSGNIINREWSEAKNYIAGLIQSHGALHGKKHAPQLWSSLVAKTFGFKWSIKELAEFSGVDRDTVAEHYAIIKPWIEAREDKAFAAVDARLKRSGMV